jgi:hypothetical protein
MSQFQRRFENGSKLIEFLTMLTKRIVLLFLGLFLLLSPIAHASDMPFEPGETLQFLLRWEFVPAGKATLTVAPISEIDGEPAYHFILSVKTNKFLDMFYKVRDKIESFTDTSMTHSVRYHKNQREGRRKRNATVTFDWKNNQAQYTRDNKTRVPVDLEPGAFDPLGIFYFVRNSCLETGVVVERPVSDGKKCVIGIGHVVKRETVTVPAGTFDTLLIEPDLKDVKGVFEKSDDSNILIWITADSRHIPVKIESKVVIGSFMGELTEAHFPESQ